MKISEQLAILEETTCDISHRGSCHGALLARVPKGDHENNKARNPRSYKRTSHLKLKKTRC